MTTPYNVDATEVAKFDALAANWWDTKGESKPLHDINPLRLDFIQRHVQLEHQHVVDIGCGGGILSEGLAKAGASTTGIDMGEQALNVARLHALDNELAIHYQLITAEDKAKESAEQFDIVCCMEMLEHVPDPISIIQACADLLKPGGSLFLSTLNRHPKAYLLAVLGAEYIMNMLPRGTHDYRRFIRPSELARWCREAGLDISHLSGISYQPLRQDFTLSNDVNVNYLMHCQKPGQK